VGVEGDKPNDFKFQYIGIVYQDLVTPTRQYSIQGTGWVFIPDDDVLGSRVMPPFAGPGNDGWTTEGGPIMTLKGQEVHIFILPTGTSPGQVLQVGDIFRFAGHIMPTLDSQVVYTVTAPSGAQRLGGGQANAIGYFYDPADDFIVDEPGRWTVEVDVWHDGPCSGGHTVPPFPHGDVLGSDDGRYVFYVVEGDAPRLSVTAPVPGFLSFYGGLRPITVTGQLPPGVTGARLDYTIVMPGFILVQGSITPTGSTYAFVFDPVSLAQEFPNLDVIAADQWRPGLADTFTVGLLLRGQHGGEPVNRANVIVLQGDQVLVDSPPPVARAVYLPLVLRSYAAWP